MIIKRKIRIGDTLQIFAGTEADRESMDAKAKAAIQAGLRAGHMVSENGVDQWMVTSMVVNPGKTGSEVYVWHPDGNRVRCRSTLFSKVNGVVVQKDLGLSWKQFQF